MSTGFLAQVRAKLYEAKFLLEQDDTVTGRELVIEKVRNALDLCAIAERLIDALAAKQESLVVDTLSTSESDPKLVPYFQSEPVTGVVIKEKP
jgi:hypothetical protein